MRIKIQMIMANLVQVRFVKDFNKIGKLKKKLKFIFWKWIKTSDKIVFKMNN